MAFPSNPESQVRYNLHIPPWKLVPLPMFLEKGRSGLDLQSCPNLESILDFNPAMFQDIILIGHWFSALTICDTLSRSPSGEFIVRVLDCVSHNWTFCKGHKGGICNPSISTIRGLGGHIGGFRWRNSESLGSDTSLFSTSGKKVSCKSVFKLESSQSTRSKEEYLLLTGRLYRSPLPSTRVILRSLPANPLMTHDLYAQSKRVSIGPGG